MVTQDELPMHHLGGRTVLAGSNSDSALIGHVILASCMHARAGGLPGVMIKNDTRPLEQCLAHQCHVMPYMEKVSHRYKMSSILKDVSTSKTSKNSAYNLCECCHSQTLSHVLGT